MKLVADKIACQRGIRTIFENISFELAEGESLVLRGPNGAGKTTLLRALAGFMPLSAGRLSLEGGPTETEISEQCHYVGHLNGIKHSLTVFENLEFWQSFLSSGGGGASIDKAMKIFGLRNLRDIPAGLMSQGQKRRLGLARLVLAHRPIWFLDEPTVSLDVKSQEILAGEIAAHVKNGGMVLAATHIPIGLDFTHVLELSPGRIAA